MKNIKKIGLGVTLSLALIMAAVSVVPLKAAAASIFDKASYVKTDSGTITVTLTDGTAIPFKDNTSNDTTYNYLPDGNGAKPYQPGNVNICQSPLADKNSQGITLTSNNASGGKLHLYYALKGQSCLSPQLADTTIVFSSSTGSTVTTCDPNTPGCTCSSQGCVQTAAASQPQDTGISNADSCSLKSNGFTLAWIFCPALEAADAVATGFMKTFESQLPFTVSENVTSNGQSLGSGYSRVRMSWSLIREISSAALVIIMLIMVISQALGGTIFEAYTIKKMLPRMIIAVIMMQISWPVLAWVVNVFNDIGQGLEGLLYAPFGGASALDFGSLLTNAHIGDGTSFFLGWFGLLAGGLLALGALPTTLTFCVAAILSLITGLFVLIFRKTLIIILLIFSPVALLLWILPSQITQRYWKLWQDNFIKVLMMYPLIIGIIAAGRIFGYIVGTQDNGTLLNFIFIMVGYFAPLFLLPKAYKWGGNFMNTVGSTASSLQNNLQKSYEPALQGWGKRRQNRWVDKYYESIIPGEEEGLDKVKPGERVKAGLRRGFFRTIAGRPLPTLRQTTQLMHEAGQWKKEELDLREGKINNEFKELQQKPGMSVQRAKELIRDKYAWSNDKLMQRSFANWSYHSRSFLELGQREWRMGGHTDENGVYQPPKGGWKPDIAKTQNWIDALHADGQFYGEVGEKIPRFQAFRLPRGGGPKPEDYLPGGPAAERDPAFRTEDAGIADLLADSEGFKKTIKQMDNPAAMGRWRPEHFEEMLQITAALQAAGKPTVARQALIDFIEEQSQTRAGLEYLQPLTGPAEKHINAIVGENDYLRKKLTGKPTVTKPSHQGEQANDDSQVNTAPDKDNDNTSNVGAPDNSNTVSTGPSARPASASVSPVSAPQQGPAVVVGGIQKAGGAFTIGSSQQTVIKLHDESIGKMADQVSEAVRAGLQDLGQVSHETGPRQTNIQPGEARTPGGVILTPGAQRNLEQNPPATPPSVPRGET